MKRLLLIPIIALLASCAARDNAYKVHEITNTVTPGICIYRVYPKEDAFTGPTYFLDSCGRFQVGEILEFDKK